MKSQSDVARLFLLDEIASLEREVEKIKQRNPNTAHGRILWQRLPKLEAEFMAKKEQLNCLRLRVPKEIKGE